MTTVPDKITRPANTSVVPVASPVNGRPDPSSVVDSEGAGFSEAASVVPSVASVVPSVDSVVSSVDSDVDTVGSSVVVVVVVTPSLGTYGVGGVVGCGCGGVVCGGVCWGWFGWLCFGCLSLVADRP